MIPFEWSNAQTISEVVAQIGPGILVKAGGVDLMDLLKESLATPKRLVNLRTVKGLDAIVDTREGLLLGPLVTLARLAADPAVGRRARVLADAAGRAATPQIRNMATLAGNLLQRPRCWYFRSADFPCRKKGGSTCFAQTGENAYHALFDNTRCAALHPSSTACALVALGASVTLASSHGNREVLLERFFVRPDADVTRENTLLPDELVTQIRLPASAPGTVTAYGKQAEKESFDWPLAEVGIVLTRERGICTRASIVLGAVAPTPHRALAAEAALVGKAIDENTARLAARAALEGATPLAQNGYKLAIVETLVRRTLLDAVREGAQP